MFELGASLAAARRRQGLDLPAAEGATCIRARHLASLEAERFDALPGRAYARAFLKTYAEFLGLDAALFLEEFDSRWPVEELEVAPVVRRRRRPVPVRFVLTGAATATVLGIVAWSGSGSHDGDLGSLEPAPAARASRPAHHVSQPRVQQPVRRVPARLVIAATRGDCWLLVRRDGESGPVLYEGTLVRGHRVRFAARHVWVRFGAPWNVDVRRGSRAIRTLPIHPGNAVV